MKQLKNKMKINVSEIRVGMLLEYKDDLWQVLKLSMLNLEKVVHLSSRNEKYKKIQN